MSDRLPICHLSCGEGFREHGMPSSPTSGDSDRSGPASCAMQHLLDDTFRSSCFQTLLATPISGGRGECKAEADHAFLPDQS